MNEIALFVSTFVLVFALGLQSLNVNGGHYWWAFFTSFVIGGSNLVLFKLAPDATTVEAFAYLAGGPFGIVISMWVHRRFIQPRARPQREDIEGRITAYLAHCDVVTVHQVLSRALDVPPAKRSVALAHEVTEILQRHGWVRMRLADASNTWAWRRAKPEAAR